MFFRKKIKKREMIKVLTIGDPHFKTDNVPEMDQMVTKIIKLVKELLPNFIVVLGDVLHRHEKIHVIPLMRAESFIKQLSEICPTFILIGNHDRPNNSTYMTNEHPFNALKLWPNTYIVDEKVMDIKLGDHRFLFVPYVFPGKFEETLNHPSFGIQNFKEVTAIFAHQEFYEAKMGAIKSQCGDKWDLSYPLIISGHIHDYDHLQENIIYVGTAIQSSFGDSTGKTVSLFNFPEGCGGCGWSEDRIDLNLPKKVIIYLDCEDVHTYVPPEDKLVKIVIRGDDAALKSVSKLEVIKQWKKKGIKIAYKSVSNISNTLSDQGRIKLKLRYKDRLYTTIYNDFKQLEWFNKLFK